MPAILACSRYFVCRHIGRCISLGGVNFTASAVGIYRRTTCEAFSVTDFALIYVRLVPRPRGAHCLLHTTFMQLQMQLNL